MAGAATAGMSDLVGRYIHSDDSTEVAVLRDIMARGIEIDGDRREDQAQRIIAELGRALDRGNKKQHRHGART